jgi:hypothetical protein
MAVVLEWVGTGQVFPLPLGRPVVIGRPRRVPQAGPCQQRMAFTAPHRDEGPPRRPSLFPRPQSAP